MEVVGCTVTDALCPQGLVAARRRWRMPDRLRLLHVDAARLPADVDDPAALSWLTEIVAEFAASADAVLIGSADVIRLYGPVPPIRVARRLRAGGAGAVFIDCAPAVMVLVCADPAAEPLADHPNDVLIGLSVTATTHGLCAALRRHGAPDGPAGWLRLAQDLMAA